MYKVSDTISVSAVSMAESGNKFKITGIIPKKQNKKQPIEVSYEQRMIEQFHEQNSPEKQKV